MAYELHWSVLWEHRGLIAAGLRMTVWLWLISIPCALAIGGGIGVCGCTNRPWMRWGARALVELNRNAPLVVQIFFLYFGLGFGAMTAAVVGLTIHQSGYIAEVVRSGIQSVPRGQLEAGRSSGLSERLVAQHILLPQALRIVIPPMANQCIDLLKSTSVAMTVGIAELTYQTQALDALPFRGFEVATGVTLLYLGLATVLAAGMGPLDARFRVRH